MPRGEKSSYTGKQKRKAEHIEKGYERRGVGEKEAARRAWATVNKESGGGKKSGSGRGKTENKSSSRKGGKKGGKASAGRSAASRSAAAKKGGGASQAQRCIAQARPSIWTKEPLSAQNVDASNEHANAYRGLPAQGRCKAFLALGLCRKSSFRWAQRVVRNGSSASRLHGQRRRRFAPGGTLRSY